MTASDRPHTEDIDCWCRPEIQMQCLICLGSGEGEAERGQAFCPAECDRGWVIVDRATYDERGESPAVIVHRKLP